MIDWSGGRHSGLHPVGGPDPIRTPHVNPHAGNGNGMGPYQPQTLQWALAAPPSAAPPPVLGPPPLGPPYLPAPPRRSRKPLIVTLCAGGAVIVVVAIVLAITLAGGPGSGGGSAGDVVKGYLEALARGDAQTALSYSDDQPATKEFLTDDILKKQIAQWPISNIRILNDDSSSSGLAGMAQVHVAANFGDKTSDTTMELKKDHDRWKLNAAAVKVQPEPGAAQGDAAAKTLTFFGKPVGDSTVYVFPGWIDVGTTNPYMTVTAKPLLLDQLGLMGMGWVMPTFVLSDKGRDAVMQQITAALGNCTRSNLLAPPNCPIHLDPDGLADGTAAWGQPDISAVKVDGFDPDRLSLMFFGQVAMPVTAKTTDGATTQGSGTAYVSGTADMAKTPPDVKFQ